MQQLTFPTIPAQGDYHHSFETTHHNHSPTTNTRPLAVRYQFIVSGHHTPEQIAHNDIPSIYRTAASRDRRLYHHFPSSVTKSPLWPSFRNGTTTYAVRVQMPLTHDITINNGPTIMCPGSHTEIYCLRYLKQCDPFFPVGVDPDQVCECVVEILCQHGHASFCGPTTYDVTGCGMFRALLSCYLF
jgi:hypothetical protein